MTHRTVRGLRRWAPPAALAATVVAFASGSSSIQQANQAGKTLRWVALFALLGVAAHYAATRDRSRPWPRGLAVFTPVAAAFLLLALVSTLWSVNPELTFKRAVSLSVVFAAAGALALGTSGDRVEIGRLLAGVFAGAAIVAGIGILLLVVDPAAAAQAATSTTPWRFRGFGENPNTVPMLVAVTAPAGLWLLLEPGSQRRRAALGATLAVFLFTVVAAQSRGALLASFFGLSVVAFALVPGPVRKLATVAGVAVVFAGSAMIRETLPPPSAPFVSLVEEVTAPPSILEREGGGNGPGPAGPSEPLVFPVLLKELPGREYEVGHPLFAKTESSKLGSGRVEAWLGALEQVAERPIMGYGFGTEATVFVDRWNYFYGGNPENAFIGLLLQLGVVGLVLFLAFGLPVLVAGGRAVLEEPPSGRGPPAACLGVFAAGSVLMVAQSYIYAVGNIATVSVWTAVFLLAGVAVGRSAPEPTAARRSAIVAADVRADSL